ncbi:permease [Acinetobacter sp. SFB]|uniref:AEC family transporter n=1 Tax=Acinetobacter sp. SFB TaxID=1805634 RepID=UPI0007D856CF|nr:permease [Acinetobacter sp. SFB]OAL80083.1 permease [Acinetobacter sp. SFB]
MALLLPLFGFLFGWGLATSQFSTRLKSLFASLLARVFIPVVIIYHMVFYQAGSLSLMLFSFVVAVLLFYFSLVLSKDPLRALCFSYVNMAWLGFPFAIALFGPEISAPMVALYVGGSIFGNIWAVTSVSSDKQAIPDIAKKVMQSPPILALSVALICRILGVQHLELHQSLDLIYSLAKTGMSFTGMCVLGMWLQQTKVYKKDLLQSSGVAVLKLGCGVVLCGLTYWVIPIPNIGQYIGVMFLLFCLPPAANIVALETYYQGTGTSARYIASGTIVSCGVVMLYGVVLHFI